MTDVETAEMSRICDKILLLLHGEKQPDAVRGLIAATVTLAKFAKVPPHEVQEAVRQLWPKLKPGVGMQG
jgi:hypothetical protein